MDLKGKQHIVSILMESPLYLTLSLGERRSLLARLMDSYPSLARMEQRERAEERAVGYESSWAGIFSA